MTGGSKVEQELVAALGSFAEALNQASRHLVKEMPERTGNIPRHNLCPKMETFRGGEPSGSGLTASDAHEPAQWRGLPFRLARPGRSLGEKRTGKVLNDDRADGREAPAQQFSIRQFQPVFDLEVSLADGWQYSSPTATGLQPLRTIQTSSPFRLDPLPDHRVLRLPR